MLEALAWRIKLALRGVYVALWPWQSGSHSSLSFTGRFFLGCIWIMGMKSAPGPAAIQARLENRFAQSAAAPMSVRPPSIPKALIGKVRIREHIPAALKRGTAEWQAFLISPVARSETSSGRNPLILYLHGGAYVQTMQPQHFAYLYDLCARTGALIVAPVYPLAPRHTYRDSFDVLPLLASQMRAKDRAFLPDDQALLEALDETDTFVLMGDSAGGGLAMALALHAAEKGSAQADEVVLISPWLDVTVSDPRSETINAVDPWLQPDFLRRAGRLWAGIPATEEASPIPKDPLVSPIFAPPSTLARFTARLSIGVGSLDILVPDGERMVERLRKENAAAASNADRAVCRVTQGMFHVFVLVSDLCEEMNTGRAWFAQRVLGV